MTRDDWLRQRAVAGFDLPPGTPVANLRNAVDGVKEYADRGITACVETAEAGSRALPGREASPLPVVVGRQPSMPARETGRPETSGDGWEGAYWR
jgi:hypothetical protein